MPCPACRVQSACLLEAEEMGKTVECLGDLQGPKFRVGELAGRAGPTSRRAFGIKTFAVPN